MSYSFPAFFLCLHRHLDICISSWRAKKCNQCSQCDGKSMFSTVRIQL